MASEMNMNATTNRNPTIGVVFPTYCSKRHLARCLQSVLDSSLRPRVLVIDSSSTDGTVEEAAALGAEVLVVAKSSFNHGTTRELARKHLGTDLVVMMTPDAYPENSEMLEKLVAPLIAGQAAVAYARQLARPGSGFFEAFPRDFNYPASSHVRGLDDSHLSKIYPFFCSDSCAAYVNSALDEIGGFKATIFGEDQIAAALLMQRGYRVAYVAEAKVEHSHSYTLNQEFRRYFDHGYAHEEYREIFDLAGQGGHGKRFIVAMFGHLAKKKPWLIPYALLNTGVKWLGYQVGKASYRGPLWIKKALSASDFYWVSDDFLAKESPTRA